jgi:hypothetical protein
MLTGRSHGRVEVVLGLGGSQEDEVPVRVLPQHQGPVRRPCPTAAGGRARDAVA